MSTVTRAPVRDRIADARADLEEIRAERWPSSREAQAKLWWACKSLEGAIITRKALAAGEMEPYEVIAPGMAGWDDPRAEALDYADEQIGDLVLAARKLLAEYRGREERALERAREWMGR